MKKLIIAGLAIFLLLVIIILIAFGYMFINKNELTRSGVERALEYALMVEVDVTGANVDIQNQSVEITGVEIANPDGYDTGHAMKFGTIRVKADIGSFRTQKPIINEITIDDSDIILEPKIGGKTNLQVLMENAQRLSEEPPPDEAQKEYKIEHVYVNQFTARVALPLSGGETVGVQVPDIHMEDVGGGEDETVTPGEAFQEFLAVLLDRIRKMGEGIIPTEVLNSIGGSLKALPADLQENISGAIEGVGTAAEQAAEDVKGAIEGIFGGRSDAEE